jgi:hyperosmotically inducible periplasmic protein
MTVSTRRRGIGRWLVIAVLACALPAMLGCQAYREGEGRTAGQVTDDLAIQTSVKSRLLADQQVSGLQIQTEVYKGVVTLFGRVPDEASRSHALQIARSVKGVVNVEDRLTIVTE